MFRLLNDLKIKTLGTAIAGLLAILAAVVVTTSSVTVERAGEMGKAWETFDKGAAAKSDILGNLRGLLGYGGMIHNFKNYVLRKDRPRLVAIEQNLLDISGAIAGYLARGVNQREKDALGTIEEVVGKYADAVDVAERLASEGATPHEIDAVVKIDDGPALDALAVLAAELLAAREASAESVYRSVAAIERFVSGTNAVTGTLTGLLIVSFLWFTRSRLVRPLAELGGAMQALAADDHAIDVPALERNDEIGAMAKTIEVFRENAILRKRAEAALRETEERFRAVVNNSPTKIHIKDRDGRYLLVNRLAEKLFGVTDEEARGKTTHEIFPEERADAFTAHDQAVLETGQTTSLEEEWFHEDGVRTFLTVKFPILDGTGNIAAVGAIGTDITEHKRARDALDRLKRQNELILRSAGEGIYGLDRQGRTTFVNPAASIMIGWKAKELIGKPQHDILHHTKPDGSPYPRDECPIYAALRDGSVHHITDEIFWRKDGSSFPVEYISTPIQERGEIVGAVVVFRDITERKRAEAALQESERSLQQRVADLEQAQRKLERQGEDLVHLADNLSLARDQAEAANRAKSEFLAAMSHELRTPLNAIIGFSEIMKDETLGPVGSVKYRDYAEDINESGQHLLGLINDVLDLSKVEAGVEELHEQDIEIHDLSRAVLTLVKERARRGGIMLKMDLADDLPMLRADERKLKQILVNLLSNAIKFTEAGGKVTLRAWCRADSDPVFQVTDTGIGIAPEDILKALSHFGQVDSDLNRQYEGTGLGLPLTKALVELHGGCLDLQSQIGVGTTATVRFPAERIVSEGATATSAGSTVLSAVGALPSA